MGNLITSNSRSFRKSIPEYIHQNTKNSSSVGEFLHSLTKSEPKHYILAEVVFYLRFFWRVNTLPSKSNFFGVPEKHSESYDCFLSMMEEFHSLEGVDQPHFEAWKSTMQNKLFDITACGHFSDTIFWNIFFDSRKQSETAIARTHEDLFQTLPAPHQQITHEKLFHVLQTFPNKSFIIRFETDIHVFSLEFPAVESSNEPCRLEDRECYLIESILNIVDVNVKKLQHKKWIRAIHKSLIISVAEYQLRPALDRINNISTACYDVEQLCSKIPYYKGHKTWDEVLTIIHSLKVQLSHLDDPRPVYSNLMQYIV
jgi:hypothetical protein